MTESIVIDEAELIDSVKLITTSHSHIYTWALTFTIIASVSLSIAFCFQLVYWMN